MVAILSNVLSRIRKITTEFFASDVPYPLCPIYFFHASYPLIRILSFSAGIIRARRDNQRARRSTRSPSSGGLPEEAVAPGMPPAHEAADLPRAGGVAVRLVAQSGPGRSR